MALLDRDLPEPSFIERDPNKVAQEMIAAYERASGKTLFPAQVERLLINQIAYRESLIREAIQDAAKLNLVRYSRGVLLDYLGENVGVSRLGAVPAQVMLRFTFSPAPISATLLPQGTEVEGRGLIFATTQPITVAAGTKTADVLAICGQPGVVGNGLLPGQISSLVAMPPGLTVASVENTTISEGGAEEEGDEHFKARIVTAPETFSVAGSVEAYRFHAMSAHSDVVDVAVVSHTPGDVTLYPLLRTGLPGETIKAAVLSACSGEKVRPLNDMVMVADPVAVDYAIDARIVVRVTADAQLALAQVERAAREFCDARMKFGISIVQSQLIDALHVYGVHSVAIVQPSADLDLKPWEWPRCTQIKVAISGVAHG